MGLHGIKVDRISGGIRPVTVAEGEVIGLLASASEATEGDVIELRTAQDVTAADDGSGTLTPAMNAIRKHTASPVVCVAIDPLNLADASGNAATFTRAYRLLQAEAETGLKPTLLVQNRVGNVEADLIAVADRLLARAFLDGTDTDDASAIADVASYDSPRTMYLDPSFTDADANTVGLSNLAAAVASVRNFWQPLSNVPLLGIDSLTRTVSGSALADAAAQSQLLNAAKITTVIRDDGWRLWGGYSVASDSQFKFLSVGTTDDKIVEAIQSSFLWAVDKGLTASFIDDVVESTRAFMRGLMGLGAIIHGDAYPDPDLNTPATATAGELYINYEFTPVYQAESITFRRHITTTGLAELFE